jgi:sterol desaturase/sphingolipid hydroxylase (fatty acid hydroxylase superfamily)
MVRIKTFQKSPELTCVIRNHAYILNTSEQPDTTKGKKMAQNAITENEKTILIAIVAGLVLVAGWAGIGAVAGFSGVVDLTATTSTILAVIAAINTILIVVMTVVFTKPNK